jgi:plasmid stabilization system protein ParE
VATGGPAADRTAADAIEAAMVAWLGGLDATQRAIATFPFDTDERFAWQYTPGPRQGLPIRDMEPDQRAAAMAVLHASLSDRGAREVEAVIALETVLGELERSAGRAGWQRRDPELYWFAVFGHPGRSGPWSWRVGGHHVAIQVTLAGGQVIGSAPSFLGANPAVVPLGPTAGARALPGEEELARRLLAGLGGPARRAAVVDDIAPDDILSGNGRRALVASISTGVHYAELDATGREALERLVRHYVERARPEVAAKEWERIRSAGLDDVTFAWAGPDEPGRGHYYAVRGPAFLIEYDNTQDGANHIHAVWRDLANDWGDDLLAQHYAAEHGTGSQSAPAA